MIKKLLEKFGVEKIRKLDTQEKMDNELKKINEKIKSFEESPSEKTYMIYNPFMVFCGTDQIDYWFQDFSVDTRTKIKELFNQWIEDNVKVNIQNGSTWRNRIYNEDLYSSDDLKKVIRKQAGDDHEFLVMDDDDWFVEVFMEKWDERVRNKFLDHLGLLECDFGFWQSVKDIKEEEWKKLIEEKLK